MNNVAPTSRRVPPDPECKNDARATWARRALHAFIDATGTDIEDALPDLLADLMHWCDRNSNVPFDDELERARLHYQAETAAEEDLLGVTMNNANRAERFAAYVKQERFVNELIAAASIVVDRWDNGDLAETVRRLDDALANLLYASGLDDMEDGHE